MAQKCNKKQTKKVQKHAILYEDTHNILNGLKITLRNRGLNVRSLDSVIKYLASYYIIRETEQPKITTTQKYKFNSADDDYGNNVENDLDEEELDNDLENEGYGY